MRKRMACLQCTKSKRKCDKTPPACKRCIERGDKCRYQLVPHLSRRSSNEVVEDQEGEGTAYKPRESRSPGETTNDTATYTAHGLPSRPSHQQDARSQTYAESRSSYTTSAPADNDSNTYLDDRWFLDPTSWETQQIPRPELALEAPVSLETLPHYISKLQSWLKRWVEEGHSPLTHRQLYRDHMPDCVQDAFTSLTAYYAATPATKPATMRMINSRANKLVQSQVYLDLDPSDFAVGGITLDTLTHVSRTQALFIYQMIRLYDGDIRSRADAELHRDVLHAWACQMFASARLDCTGAALLCHQDAINTYFPPVNGLVTTLNQAVPSDPPSLWRAWILAESVRRTYLMVTFMLSVYHNLEHGWSVCPGGVSFTAGNGLWDAETPWTWYTEAKSKVSAPGGNQSVSKSLLLLDSLDAWGILQDNKPSDVDAFTIAILEIAYGLDLVEKWSVKKGGG